MLILNTEFSSKGFEEFCKLTKEEQTQWLRKRNKLYSPKEIFNALKSVKYAKLKRNTKTSKKSDKAKTSKRSAKDSD